jgi:hypothetical protein
MPESTLLLPSCSSSRPQPASRTRVRRYYCRLNNGINLVPFTGIGLIHADLDRGTGPGRIDRNDTSWYIPLGVSVEYQAAHNLALSSTLIVNLYDINLSAKPCEGTAL